MVHPREQSRLRARPERESVRKVPLLLGLGTLPLADGAEDELHPKARLINVLRGWKVDVLGADGDRCWGHRVRVECVSDDDLAPARMQGEEEEEAEESRLCASLRGLHVRPLDSRRARLDEISNRAHVRHFSEGRRDDVRRPEDGDFRRDAHEDVAGN